MGAAKESPATQVLEWAVGKLDEASKIDWVEKLSSLTASRPAYLRNGLLGAAAPSMSAPAAAPSGGDAGASQAELDAALTRAAQAEVEADSLAKRVTLLEQQLASRNSRADVELSAEEAPSAEDDEHRPHWWSRHH